MCKGGPLGLRVSPIQGQTWAAIAAQAAHTVNTAVALYKVTVCVWLKEPQGYEPEKLLKTIQRIILNAYAVYTLNNRDIDIYVPS